MAVREVIIELPCRDGRVNAIPWMYSPCYKKLIILSRALRS